MSAPRAEAQNTPAAPVTAPADPATAGSGSPSGTAPPAQPPAQDPGQTQGATGGAPVTAVGGIGTGPGPGAVPGGGTQPGSGGSGSSANAGGNGGGSRPSAGGTSTAPTTAPAQPPSLPDSGTYRYRNGNNSKCITQVFGSSDFGDCGNGSARWTVRSRSDGSFKLVNQQSGSCLYSNGLGQAVFVGDCAQDIGRVWRTGSGGSLRSDLGGGCLDLGMSSGLVTKTCGGEASQRWTKQS
ncbi:RICIN domain-containing protein [Streptomyces erythrochromogenes]